MQKQKLRFPRHLFSNNSLLSKKENKPRKYINYLNRLNLYLIPIIFVFFYLVILSLNVINPSDQTNICGTGSLKIEIIGSFRYNLERRFDCSND